MTGPTDQPECERRFVAAFELYDRGQCPEAFGEFLWCAQRGHIRAAYSVGWLYTHGVGVRSNFDRAVHWYERAATEDVSAAYNLGLIHKRVARADGREIRTARRWLRRAAKMGKHDAWSRYGEIYLGSGVLGRNDRRALALFRKGARLGAKDSEYRLGLAYEHGRGTPVNEDEAVRWLELAAEHGHTGAAVTLGVIYSRAGRDQKAAVRWTRSAARMANPMAQCNLGVLYLFGRGVQQDATTARSWFARAARNGDATAQFNLATMMAKGEGGPLNIKEAWFWARLAQEGREDGAEDLVQDWRERLTTEQIVEIEDQVERWLAGRKRLRDERLH